METEDAYKEGRKFAVTEGILVGISSGAALTAASGSGEKRGKCGQDDCRASAGFRRPVSVDTAVFCGSSRNSSETAKRGQKKISHSNRSVQSAGLEKTGFVIRRYREKIVTGGKENDADGTVPDLERKEKNHQKMISALERAFRRGNGRLSWTAKLAQAYCSSADTENRELFQKALKLLKPHEGYFGEDYSWNFRIAFAYFYLDREASALRYFKRALAQRPEDGETRLGALISACRSRLTLPRFEKNFRQRTAEAWTEFAAGEEELRRLIDRNNRDDGGEELAALCSSLLSAAFSDVSFELGYDGQKYELILTPGRGSGADCLNWCIFRIMCPDFLREKWNIWGRPPAFPGILSAVFRAGSVGTGSAGLGGRRRGERKSVFGSARRFTVKNCVF